MVILGKEIIILIFFSSMIQKKHISEVFRMTILTWDIDRSTCTCKIVSNFTTGPFVQCAFATMNSQCRASVPTFVKKSNGT